MKNNLTFVLAPFFCLCLLWSSAVSETVENPSASSPAKSPLKSVEVTINELVEVVNKYPSDEKGEEKREQMRLVITPRFDFKEMAKRSLGAYWLKITPEEQEEFTDVFSDLLAKTYLNRIENIEEGMVKLHGQKVHGVKALVKTIVKYKDDTFPLDYRLLQRAGDWKVYDVIIENIGLVQNYRNEFKGIIRKHKFSGLMQKLKNKLAK